MVSGLLAVWNQGCPVLKLHRFFVSPSSLLAVVTGHHVPCRPRYALHGKGDTRKAQAPRLPSPKAAELQAPEAQRPWDWAVSSGDESHVVFVSPHRIHTVLTNSTSASTPLHPDGARRRGGEPASVSLPPPPSTPPPQIQSNAISQSNNPP